MGPLASWQPPSPGAPSALFLAAGVGSDPSRTVLVADPEGFEIEVGDAGVFFGRNRVVQALQNRVLANRFVALTGPSGSGKSSLLSAGLVPRLSPPWLVASLRSAKSPLAALARALASLPMSSGDLRLSPKS